MENKPPIARAGIDEIITLPNDSVLLDGSTSSDVDGIIITYKWANILSPASPNISTPDSSKSMVSALIEGFYQFELTVQDDGGLFAKDTVQVSVNALVNQPPLAYGCNDTNRTYISAQLIPAGKMTLAGVRRVVASVGNKIVFAGDNCCGGSDAVDIYDIITQTCTPARLSIARWGMAVVSAGNRIFFAGGTWGDGSSSNRYYNTVDIYDVSTNTWSVAALSRARSGIAAAVVGNKVFFAGGETERDYAPTDIVDIYDLSTNTWSKDKLSAPRSYITAATINNKIYFAGGHVDGQNGYTTKTIDIYDNATGTWSTAALHEPKVMFSAIAAEGKIYWAGGFAQNYKVSCEVEIEDVATRKRSFANLFKEGVWLQNAGYNPVIKDRKIIFLRTGWLQSPDDKFDMFDMATGTWLIGKLPGGMTFQEASVISVNNTIYLGGGYVNGVPSNQIYKLEF